MEWGPFGLTKNFTLHTEEQLDAAKVGFADVAGCDGAKHELQEVVEMLSAPEKYVALGATLPKGVLLSGPPGTGKTLLARALAGEAGCAFFTASASSFVEMFSGLGAARVATLFATARAAGRPAIVFIDEIDALGRTRTGVAHGGGSGNDERDATLNQLLVEMDGFKFTGAAPHPVLVVAATNQPEALDGALTRPGRFDRRVHVGLPDVAGRLAILQVHARRLPLAPDADLAAVARGCTGFSGAQLAAVVNEAAISAATAGDTAVGQAHLEGALDRLLLGPAKVAGGSALSSKSRRLLAYHEAGHALVGLLRGDVADEVVGVTIVPRGAGGHTRFLPRERQLETGLYTRRYLEARMEVALSGRAAEELVYGKEHVTTSAYDDLQQVADLAQKMVKQFGFGKTLGQGALVQPATMAAIRGEMDLPWTYHPMAVRGGGVSGSRVSKATAAQLDGDVRNLVEERYSAVQALLRENEDALHAIAASLSEKETLSGAELRAICAAHGIEYTREQ